MSCPFCEPDPSRVFWDEDATVFCLWDAFAVNPGHALVLPRRHVSSWFDTARNEQASLLDGIDVARREIQKRHDPAGFNIGINVGDIAGQTVPHLHVHVIPRYAGDVPDPRGGVRWVIPDKANYSRTTGEVRESVALAYGTSIFEPEILGWSERPLGERLLQDLSHADAADIAVAFVTEGGIERIAPYLQEILQNEGRVRFLTGDYLDFTDPRALSRLLDLASDGSERTFDLNARVFETTGELGFHPKAYLLPGRAAYIGSSNLSERALDAGVEWNYRISDATGIAKTHEEFDALFDHPRTRELTPKWIAQYRARRRRPNMPLVDAPDEAPRELPEPHAIQAIALEKLEETRAAGNRAGLVVLATGLGKTWLSAFDTRRFERVLFVAHREEILRQARDTFRTIRPDSTLGYYTGGSKDSDADVLFASVQSLGKKAHLDRFKPDTFDYIVVDEFHHASAATYRRLIDYFQPRFLLGLTATPDRSDGADLLALCGENLVYRCDLVEGIQERLLSPFHYFGVPDEVEYGNIPWRNGRFDPGALESAVATQGRAENAWEQWHKHLPRRTLAFCVSTRHADFMRRFFSERGVRVAAVHSGPGSDRRAEALDRLKVGELQVIFAVDMFNEGVDVPAIDAVLMLRPTESRILWLQQIGRGLRKARGKERLTIIDYIGNHRTFLKSAMLLLPGADAGPQALRAALTSLRAGQLELPPGCEVTYDLRALEILENLIPSTRAADAVATWYREFKERNDRRPSAVEAFHAGYNPRALRRTHGSWIAFVKAMNDLDRSAEELFGEGRPSEFLVELETTSMTKSFKMLVLLVLLSQRELPGRMAIPELAQRFGSLVRRFARLRGEILVDPDDMAGLQAYVERNPIRAWITQNRRQTNPFFTATTEYFESTFEDSEPHTEAFRELARELVDWRIAEYLARSGSPEGATTGTKITCKIIQSQGRPILKLPSRSKDLAGEIPTGEIEIDVNGTAYTARFAKEFVNVIRRGGENRNSLGDLVKSWFGPQAGQPGTSLCICFERSDGSAWRLRPLAPGEATQPHLDPDIAKTRKMKVRDDHNREIDATFSLERDHTGAVSIIFESRGGTGDTVQARNTEYAKGLQTLLSRLASGGYRILDALLDTETTRELSIEDRRLRLESVGDYPVDPGKIDSIDLQRALSRAQGNNPTRRIRIATSASARGQELSLLLGFFERGES